MRIKIKRHTLESKVDIKKRNNSRWRKYIPINNIGFVYNCVFKQRKAFEYSLNQIRKIYPESNIYVVSDGGFNYSYLGEEKVKIVMEEDTKSCLKLINEKNFLDKENQLSIKKEMGVTLRRVKEGIRFCNNPEWICMTEPDVIIRGRISYPEKANLLGMRVNYAWHNQKCLDMFMDINHLLSKIPGSIPILRWGAVPVIFRTEIFYQAIEKYEQNFDLLNTLTEKYYNVGAFDLFLPIIFCLIGVEETFSNEFTECIRNPNWKKSKHPIVHQYRELYETDDFYYSDGSNYKDSQRNS